MDELLLGRRAADRLGDRAGVARDGGRVAGGHPVAQRQRLDQRGEHADLQRGELRRARSRAARRAPGRAAARASGPGRGTSTTTSAMSGARPTLVVDERDGHGERRRQRLGRQQRDEDPADLLASERPCAITRGPAISRKFSEVRSRRRRRRPRSRRRRRRVVPAASARAIRPPTSGKIANVARLPGAAPGSGRADRVDGDRQQRRSRRRAPGPRSAMASTSAMKDAREAQRRGSRSPSRR